jgi:hypothetical protein
MDKVYRRRSQLAFGFAVAFLVALGESTVVHQRMPSPLSPWVWGGLTVAAALCLGAAWWYRRQALGASV